MSNGSAYPGVELRVSTPPVIGEAVLQIQRRLAELSLPCADIRGAKVPRNANGIPLADIAGVFGSRTANAVKNLQRSRGLHQDGVVGPRTWAALFGQSSHPGQTSAPPVTGPPLARPSIADVEARDTDLEKLHPEMRDRVRALLEELSTQGAPMRVFEAYRSPERQQHLFSKGRNAAGVVIDKRAVVTRARAFESYHQYGLAVDVVIDRRGVNPWETGTAEARGWWQKYHQIAEQTGLEPLSFEMPHVQLKGLTTAGLLRGAYPNGGGDSWATNLSEAINRWKGAPKPVAPSLLARPPLARLPPGPSVPGAERLNWDSLPRVADADWDNPLGGQPWRVDQHGIYLESVGLGQQPLRSKGVPKTCEAIVEMLGVQIQKYSTKYRVPVELIVMTIATETGMYREDRFTGPKTFRWEENITDYSAGPMQMLSETARRINKQANLGYDDGQFPAMAKRPAQPPDDLALYDPEVAIDVGAALIRRIIDGNGTNPILVAAAYNAGSVRPSDRNPWKIHCFGDHLEHAAQWYGDACEVVAHLRA